MAGVAKPKLSTVSAKSPAPAKFALGSRPESLRDQPVKRVTPPKLPNTRDYGKTQSQSQPAPPAAIQPGNPMPSMGGSGGL